MRLVLTAYESLAGHKEEALADMQEILSQAQHRYVSPVHLANAYLGLDDFEKAFDLMEKGFQERNPILRTFIALPFLDLPYPRTHDPRLQDLVRRIRSFSASSRSGAA